MVYQMKRRACFCVVILALLGARASVVSGPREGPDPPADGPDTTYRGGLVAPPLPKPRFTLTDTSGAPFDFWRRTDGHVTLLFFGYARCPDQCPLHMANIALSLKKLPAGAGPGVTETKSTPRPPPPRRVNTRPPQFPTGGAHCSRRRAYPQKSTPT